MEAIPVIGNRQCFCRGYGRTGKNNFAAIAGDLQFPRLLHLTHREGMGDKFIKLFWRLLDDLNKFWIITEIIMPVTAKDQPFAEHISTDCKRKLTALANKSHLAFEPDLTSLNCG